MPQNHFTLVIRALVLAVASAPAAFAQGVRVDVDKRAAPVPPECVRVSPASLAGEMDIAALVKEALCKGSGDMLADYTYIMSYARRDKGDKGEIRQESVTYEVYMPTTKGGTHGRGVLLVTRRNGVPLPPEVLEKERTHAGEQLEKEEKRVARASAKARAADEDKAEGMLPLGMYARTTINRDFFGMPHGATLDIHTFLETSALKFIRREQADGRETFVFSFTPRPDAQYDDKERYIASLTGTVWIDAADRIVTRLIAWPSDPLAASGAGVPAVASPARAGHTSAGPASARAASVGHTSAGPASAPGASPAPPSDNTPPAVLFRMTRLPEGVWLPSAIRVNGLDYPALFDRVNYEVSVTYTEYKRFTTETKDVKLDEPKPQ